MNSEIRTVLPKLVGKTIAHVVLKEGSGPAAQLFLVFDDGTYYEFYSDAPIDGAGAVDVGGVEKVIEYGKRFYRVLFRC